MRIYLTVIFCAFHLIVFSQYAPKKINKYEHSFFVSVANENDLNLNKTASLSIGADFLFYIQHFVHSYSKTQGDIFKSKPFFVTYQPSIRFQPDYRASFRNSFLLSLYNNTKRTGPFSGYTFDYFDLGISIQNGFEPNGIHLAGIQMIFKLYLPTKGYNFKRLNFHLGMNYFFALNERSKEFSGLYGEFAIRLRINKIPVGGF